MSAKERIFDEAKSALGDKSKLREIVGKSAKKLKNKTLDSDQWKDLKSKAGTLVTMLQCHISGQYRSFSTPSLLLIVFALLYFLIPTDAIPDFMPAIGFTDDASVLLLIYRKLSKDIERFLEWQASTKTE